MLHLLNMSQYYFSVNPVFSNHASSWLCIAAPWLPGVLKAEDTEFTAFFLLSSLPNT